MSAYAAALQSLDGFFACAEGESIEEELPACRRSSGLQDVAPICMYPTN
jgi:hypothetical protein